MMKGKSAGRRKEAIMEKRSIGKLFLWGVMVMGMMALNGCQLFPKGSKVGATVKFSFEQKTGETISISVSPWVHIIDPKGNLKKTDKKKDAQPPKNKVGGKKVVPLKDLPKGHSCWLIGGERFIKTPDGDFIQEKEFYKIQDQKKKKSKKL